MRSGIIRKYKQFFPDIDEESIVSLGEGDTPLIFAPRVASEIGFHGQLFFKYEGSNPTGSFKDRGMTAAVSASRAAKAFLCASTGNTAASAAAYAAEIGITVFVLVPAGGIAEGKRTQIQAYGATIIEINGNFDACQGIVHEIGKKYPDIVLLNNSHPYRLPGQKTAAFEVWEELGSAPDYHFIPVGNAGNITAYWMGYVQWETHVREEQMRRLNNEMTVGEGFVLDEEERQEEVEEYFEDSNVKNLLNLPKMMGYQAEGAAPIVRGHAIEDPKTIASAINIGNPARWKEAVEAVSSSGGRFDMVTDAEISHFHKLIPRLCPQAACEPSSAVSVAGLSKAIRANEIENNEDITVVCTLTGAWWKDQDAFKGKNRRRAKAIEPNLEAVEKILNL